ncbi:putative toxin-antitoxin system antitoxin component, TIGR02293 family [Hymenobacter daecheongensis DSM 21074]|uniref:Putative toxin-antitoxin system antitoxin component, TIGR02293 family n=1 Tax=Hymenobacter daecheongensis DSM 21074 TaxID=1121955 RepID=A0A1M6HLE5_9BACT|nr:antitoxin Xre-like helix-turn-helix domain-containing protein [Hymenobacter daecheongensis]SHJ23013.1 putative toxin-antitoxin system antitoxin component, TIGR02293 family [Hymenobacter daecheongensis DSM 21074]
MTVVRKTSVANMVELMGGPAVIPQLVHNELDLLAVAIKGISVQALRTLQQRLRFTNKEISAVLGVSESTLARREQANKALTLDEGEKTIQLSAVLAKGLEVFEDEGDFHHWLNTNNVALGGIRPIQLLSSAIGRDKVVEILFRIEYGMYS